MRYLKENLAAAEIQLSNSEIAQLEAIFPPGAVAGEGIPSKEWLA
jgi:aryl-alcohol dehydrogenase-like predicted oxidoreductase